MLHYAPRYEDAWGGRGIVAGILNLRAGWR
jgi:hypothetical protein